VNPATPVIPEHQSEEIVIAKEQHPYAPLHALRIGEPRYGVLLTRWQMTWRERLRALVFGEVYLQLMTFNGPVQPVKLTVESPIERSGA
jgi:hypothetical protein